MDFVVGVPDKGIIGLVEGGLECHGAVEREVLPGCFIEHTWDSLLVEIAANELLSAVGGAVIVNGPVIEFDETGQMFESVNNEMRLILNNHC